MSGPAGRFEVERNKIGELQVDIVARLARSLGVELVKAEALRSMRERPNNPDAAALAMRASARFNSSGDSKSINSDVIDLSERALALDPQNERAMVAAAIRGALTDRVTNQWSDDPAGDLARAEKVRRLRFGPSAGRCVGPHGEGASLLRQTAT